MAGRWTIYENYAFMFAWIQIEHRRVLLRKIIRGVMGKIVRWKSKHKVKGVGKVREEPNS
jgi:hypothetical protein